MEMEMESKIRRDARFATAFAALVCAWALALVALGLAAPLRDGAAAPASAVLTADARP
jgi:hypothetical protein